VTAPDRLSVSVVCTVLNEAASIEQLLGSLLSQTRRPDEVVIVDGGSTDGTWQALVRWQGRGLALRLLRRPGAGISRGRNEAIRACAGEIVAVTDAGVRLDANWLAALVAPFLAAEPPEVVSGFFVADPRSLFELALGATTLPELGEIRPETFLPSSRSVAFRRAAWAAVGGYPEWLDYCEDLVFDFALRRSGRSFGWAPAAIAYFRPRENLARFFVQYYRYARGDGKALLWAKRHAVRYATYLGGPLLCWRTRAHPLMLLLLVLGAGAYCRRPFRRLAPSLSTLSPADRARALALVPLIRLTGDLAKMVGYPVGLLWRARHRVGPPCRPLARSATLHSPPGAAYLT
jgi:glycosyltransferase involved in cell wall biosynthesis